MKIRIYLFIIFCFAALTGIGQIKMGDNPVTIHPGAILELESTNRGLLLPRIKLDDVRQWTLKGNPVHGMVIYNETGSEDKGLYYWDNDIPKWVRVINSEEIGSITSGTGDDNQMVTIFRLSGNSITLELQRGGGQKSIDLSELLTANNITINDGIIDIDGDGTPDNNVTVEDVIGNLQNIVSAGTETLTTLKVVNDSLVYTDEDKQETKIPLGDLETTTSIKLENDSLVYTDEDKKRTSLLVDTHLDSVLIANDQYHFFVAGEDVDSVNIPKTKVTGYVYEGSLSNPFVAPTDVSDALFPNKYDDGAGKPRNDFHITSSGMLVPAGGQTYAAWAFPTAWGLPKVFLAANQAREERFTRIDDCWRLYHGIPKNGDDYTVMVVDIRDLFDGKQELYFEFK